ncbi:MAG: hypothetical protein IJX17_07280 [Clostridia bacterium]|nr:hypothetical protein [Clostridia bacterium]
METKVENNEEKITDKAFNRALIISILGILMCMVCLCSSTWAWFKDDVVNNKNVIESASYGIVSIVKLDGTSEEIVETEKNTYTLTSGKYQVTLNKEGDARYGYVIISDDIGSKIYTETMNDTQTTFTYVLEITADKIITFKPCLGMYAGTPDVLDGGTITF